MNCLELGPYTRASGEVQLPGSKSISNRVLLLAALSVGDTIIDNLLDCDDTQVMLKALEALGVFITRTGRCYKVKGTQGTFPVRSTELFLGNAGTAMRSLTAALAVNHGAYRLSGVPRMCARPIHDLVDALRQLGAVVDYLGGEGFPPLAIKPVQLAIREPIKVRGDVSSQFLSALLMALPRIPVVYGDAVIVEVVGELISRPYVDMTLRLMASFGIVVSHDKEHRFILPAHSQYRSPGYISVEGDASSASYFLAAGVLGGGPVRVKGVGHASMQGDVQFAQALSQMGAQIRQDEDWLEASAPLASSAIDSSPAPSLRRLAPLDMDCNHIPDAAMTLAIAALFAEGTTTLRNIASWRVKETDRIEAMATELRKLGAIVETGEDFIQITPPAKLNQHVMIDTYDDHRMAMCFSLVSLAGVPITINEPECVSKTFPDYFEHFRRIVRP